MIHKLDINNRYTRLEIIELQRAGYVIEAALINYYEIPGLLEDESSLLETTEIFYGYSTHEKLVGIISYNIFDTTLDIHRLVVHPDYFNRGIATAMLKQIENHSKEIKRIIVSTGKKNYPAYNLYLKLGFKVVEEKEIAEGLAIVFFEKNTM